MNKVDRPATSGVDRPEKSRKRLVVWRGKGCDIASVGKMLSRRDDDKTMCILGDRRQSSLRSVGYPLTLCVVLVVKSPSLYIVDSPSGKARDFDSRMRQVRILQPQPAPRAAHWAAWVPASIPHEYASRVVRSCKMQDFYVVVVQW